MRATLPHFEAIKAKAEQLGWPKRFSRDLYTHDRKALAARDAALPFLWTVSEDGTHLVKPEPKPTKSARPVVDAIRECFPSAKWFWWDGRGLWEVDHESAVRLIEGIERPEVVNHAL